MDRRQDIRRREYGEQQVRSGHRRRSPERNQPTHVQGVTHVTVEQWRPKFEICVRLTRKIQRHLPEAEQVKVVDQQRSYEHQTKTQAEHHVNGVANCRICEVPSNTAEGLPECEECKIG